MAVPTKNSTMPSLDTQRMRFLGRWLIVLFLCWLSPSSRATTITNLTEQAFTNALNTGGTIKFAVSGVLELTSTKVITNNVVIDAENQSVIFSGGGSNRLFMVMSTGNLTIRYATLSNACFIGAAGANGSPSGTGSAGTTVRGGAIFNSNGILQMLSCTLISNKVIGGAGGKGGNSNGSLSGGNGGVGGDGRGGSVGSLNGKVTLFGCLFTGNQAIGGRGGFGGDGILSPLKSVGSGANAGNGFGGDICVEGAGGIIYSTNTTFSSSIAAGGWGGISAPTVQLAER